MSLRQLREAESVASIVSVQNCMTPFDQGDLGSGVLAHCAARGIAYLAYSPFGGSRGKNRVAEDPTLRRIGERRGVSPFQVALAWLLTRSPVVIPIPGARRVEAARDNVAAMCLALDVQDLAELDAVFPPRPDR